MIRRISSCSWFVLLLAAYATAGAILLGFYRYKINPDAISYITIARKYLAGDWTHAVNGHWSPLWSWLLVPFLKTSCPPPLALRILALLAGLLTLIGMRRLSYRFDISENLRLVVLALFIPSLLSFALIFDTPDLLVTALLVFYVNGLFAPDYGRNWGHGAVSGILGGLAYLTKSYAFPFFLVHFTVFSLFHYRRCESGQGRRMLIFNFAAGMLVFVAISGVWIHALTEKYGYSTLSTAGRYNNSFVGPGSQGHPVHDVGLWPPPNQTAVSAWEDPSYLPAMPWSPFSSGANFRHGLKLAAGNAWAWLVVGEKMTLFFVVILGAYLWLCYRPLGNRAQGVPPGYPLVTVAAYSAGYILLLIQARYLWLVNVLVLLMGGHLLSEGIRRVPKNRWGHAAAALLFAFSFLLMPIANLAVDFNNGRSAWQLIERVGKAYPLAGNIASYNEWQKSQLLAYHLSVPYYGQESRGPTSDALQKKLSDFRIDYYLIWGNVEEPPTFLATKREITGGTLPNLKIYALK